ncbi:phosphatidylglycerophosphatase A [bacterium]|nr:phosphatidylglycerophosphatase A [bacterium]
MRFLSHAIATGLYVGHIPFFPGTLGSLLGLALYWIIPGSESLPFLVVILVLFAVGAWAATEVEKQTGIKDNQKIVIDEVVGTLLTLALFEKKIIWLCVGFLFFRVLDIVKLFPTKQTERLPEGWGVMMDDVVAGVYAAVALRLLCQLVGTA